MMSCKLSVRVRGEERPCRYYVPWPQPSTVGSWRCLGPAPVSFRQLWQTMTYSGAAACAVSKSTLHTWVQRLGRLIRPPRSRAAPVVDRITEIVKRLLQANAETAYAPAPWPRTRRRGNCSSQWWSRDVMGALNIRCKGLHMVRSTRGCHIPGEATY